MLRATRSTNPRRTAKTVRGFFFCVLVDSLVCHGVLCVPPPMVERCKPKGRGREQTRYQTHPHAIWGGRKVEFPKNWQETNRGVDTPERTLSWSVSPGTPIPPVKEKVASSVYKVTVHTLG